MLPRSDFEKAYGRRLYSERWSEIDRYCKEKGLNLLEFARELKAMDSATPTSMTVEVEDVTELEFQEAIRVEAEKRNFDFWASHFYSGKSLGRGDMPYIEKYDDDGKLKSAKQDSGGIFIDYCKHLDAGPVIHSIYKFEVEDEATGRGRGSFFLRHDWIFDFCPLQ